MGTSKNKDSDGAIVTITTNNNYGNIMQRWALQRFLSNHGYNFISYYFYGYYIRQYLPRYTKIFAVPRKIIFSILGKSQFHSEKSSKLYCYKKLSHFCNTRIRQRLFVPFFHKKYRTFIIGSDQNLNYDVTSKEFLYSWRVFLLNFVKWDACKISYASSFGSSDNVKKNQQILQSDKTKKLVKSFDFFSVREAAGVEAADCLWGIKAKEVVDPTMLLAVDEYDELIETSPRQLEESPKIFYYILRDDAKRTLLSFAQRLAAKLKFDIGGVSSPSTEELPSVEQWLKNFRDSKIVVTNSFHGLIFSLINHTDFIILSSRRASGGSVRYRNLLQKCGLEDRLVEEEDFDKFDYEKLKKIDWGLVESAVCSMRKDSGKWLLGKLLERSKK